MSSDNNAAPIDMDDLEFEFTLKNHSDASLEPFVILFSGYVRGWDENAGEDRNLGNIIGFRINLKSARAQKLEQHKLLEQLSAEIADFAETVMGDESVLSTLYPDMQCVIEGRCNYLIYVAEISIEPEFRCMGLGSTLLSKIPVMMDVHESMVALKAFPLMFKYGSSSSADEVKRVKHFYEKQGFKHVGGEYMAKVFD
jgi:ribosomal protein S18 acetylase RimI-like enzyme